MKKIVRRCLISVSDKTDIIGLAKFLGDNNVDIVSTGGTKKTLLDNKINVIDIEDYTGMPEILGGRVKTLHPKVHGGLLGKIGNKDHIKEMFDNDINEIDLLVVNLYPFEETVARTNNEDEIVENIDIGGPAMIRSAAKNFLGKVVVTSPDQYGDLKNELSKNNFTTDLDFRKKMASEAFRKIAKYDAAISSYFNKSNVLEINANLVKELRYGENPHQKASYYSNSDSGIVNARQLQGKELSYNNLNDSDAAYNLVMEFNKPVCAIIKHANPCGVAIADDELGAFRNALEVDSKSAFGGIVAINGRVDEGLADEISKIFFEVVIAKSYTEGALKKLFLKKNLRLLEANFLNISNKQVKSISGGFLVQEQDSKVITKNDLELATKTKVSEEGVEQLLIAINICKHVKSNAITIVKDYRMIGVGAGQTSRVDSCEIACKKAENNGGVEGAYLASDAFLPFADNVQIAAKYGIGAIIAPKGSIRDQEVVDEANKQGVALYFISSRHFRH